MSLIACVKRSVLCECTGPLEASVAFFLPVEILSWVPGDCRSTDAYRAASAFPEAAKHETSRALVVASGRSTRGPLSAFNINSSGATGADGDDREVEEKETLSLTDSRPTAFQLANGTNEGYFDWLCRPENAQNQLRMSDGVRQLYQLSSRGMMEGERLLPCLTARPSVPSTSIPFRFFWR